MVADATGASALQSPVGTPLYTADKGVAKPAVGGALKSPRLTPPADVGGALPYWVAPLLLPLL